MKTHSDLSIIIVSYNTRELLSRCLRSIFASLAGSRLQFEVIVVDNHSSDGTPALLAKTFPQVRLIKNPDNFGFARGNNQGIAAARSATILLLNSDTEVLDKGINELYLFFKTLPHNSIVGGRLFNLDGSPQPSCGPAYSLLHIFIALFLKGDYVGMTRYSPKAVKQVDWVMGACIMMEKSTFTAVGGFDESIFMYMEEIDFEYRAKLKGSRIFFCPQAKFIHVGAGSSQGRETPILNVFRGFLFYYKKHRSAVELFILRILLLLKSISAIFLFSLLNKKTDRNLYIKAFKIAKS